MSPRSIPEITHLQFLVLGLLRAGGRHGRVVRRVLQRHGATQTAPAFYQMMARLEDAGLVAGEYDQKIVDSQIIKERRYTLTARGEDAWSATRRFYSGAIATYGAKKPRLADA